MQVPIWGVAIVIAAIAPFCVKAMTQALQRRRAARTKAFLADLSPPKEHAGRGDG